MSEILEMLTRVQTALDRPTVRLLDGRKWAPVTLAVFHATFDNERRSVAVETLHGNVDSYLHELRLAGVETPPGASGRSLCVQWMNDQWLYRAANEKGVEEYSLTSHALEALRVVESLNVDRAMISESRLTTILDAARKSALEANPNREDRLRYLEADIARLSAERDRLLAGGDIAEVSESRMLDNYQNLLDLISLLPGDFRRVEEAVRQMHRQVTEDFRREERPPIGEVIDEYLERTERLMTDTAEGRAFEGAFDLLRSNALLEELRTNLQVILDHPFAAVLTPTEESNFRNTVRTIRAGMRDVLERRRRLSSTLRDHIVNHDLIRDRELEQSLRKARTLLAAWMQDAKTREKVELELVPPPLDLAYFKARFYDPSVHMPPPPLDDVTEGAPEQMTLDDLKRIGGPQFDALRAALLEGAVAADVVTAGQVFNGLEKDLRRPVEVLGIVHIVTEADVLQDGQESEEVTAIRTDGSTRVLAMPRTVLKQLPVGSAEEADGAL